MAMANSKAGATADSDADAQGKTPRTAAAGTVSASTGASDRQALAALGPASVDDGAATTALHSNKKPVRACAANFGSLIGAFHIDLVSPFTR